MILYNATSAEFINDVISSKLTKKIENSFEMRWGYKPNQSEVYSWENSLPKIRDILQLAQITDAHIVIEYEVPYCQHRIDCMIFGKDIDQNENILIVELKQWSDVTSKEETKQTTISQNSDEANLVETYVGGSIRDVPHPSEQIKNYENYLKCFVSEFHNEKPVQLTSIAYCHNYKRINDSGLFAHIYKDLISKYPVFCRDDVSELIDLFKNKFSGGKGLEVYQRFVASTVQPSKKLLEEASNVINTTYSFSLLEEQLVAKNMIWSSIAKSNRSGKKSVIIVHGGPGTGKSLIGINVLSQALAKKKTAFFACKSKPLIEGINNKLNGNSKKLFTNLYNYVPSKVKENSLDLLLIDEAHRIEKTSNHTYTKKEDHSDLPQVDQLIKAAKTSVFFIDDKQSVRSQEIGSSSMIRDAAIRNKCEIKEITLNTQFRCNGSNEYIEWLDYILGYSNKKTSLAKADFDFKIFDNPNKLYEEIKQRDKNRPNSARVIAGFCWPWSKELDENGEPIKDIKIGNDFAMPWETHMNVPKVPQGYVKWYEWGYKPEGIKQIGCIYTAQGFEFDYIGVIIGNDIKYCNSTGALVTDIANNCDPTLKKNKNTFDTHVRNIYRTLLTRGIKGCYVYFVNKETEHFFRNNM